MLPEVRRLRPDFSLSVIGVCPQAVRAELERPGLRFLGYVDDLEAELTRHRAFLAPLRSGTGVKTKVLEAMAVGLPVVTTSYGITGMTVADDEQCLIADSAAALARRIARLSAEPATAAAIGAAGRRYALAEFSDAVVTERWKDLLTAVAPEIDAALAESPGSAAAVR